jgi:hypothetical protein
MKQTGIATPIGYTANDVLGSKNANGLLLPACRQRPLKPLQNQCFDAPARREWTIAAGLPSAMQREQPCEEEQTACQCAGDPLHAGGVLQAIRSRGENEAHDAAHRETCDMRPDIRALAAEAKKGKKHDPGSKRRPPTNPASPRN